MVFPASWVARPRDIQVRLKRTAKKMTSALTASASVAGMISGPIAAASDAKLSGSRVVATDTSMPLRANAWPGLADFAEADNCVACYVVF